MDRRLRRLVDARLEGDVDWETERLAVARIFGVSDRFVYRRLVLLRSLAESRERLEASGHGCVAHPKDASGRCIVDPPQ